jgi:hypothetical protein
VRHFFQTLELFAVASLALLASAAWAEPSASHESRYDVRSRGLRVGEVVTTRQVEQRPEGRFVRVRVEQNIKVSLLWLKVQRESTEEALLGPDGVVEFRRRARVDGREIEVDAVLRDGLFRFAIREDGRERSWEVPRAGYDITSMDGFELQVDAGASITKRVLSLGELEVTDRTFRRLPDETFRADGAPLACRVVDLQDARKQSRRWVREDGWGMAILRQDGRDVSGAYSMRLRTGTSN